MAMQMEKIAKRWMSPKDKRYAWKKIDSAERHLTSFKKLEKSKQGT